MNTHDNMNNHNHMNRRRREDEAKRKTRIALRMWSGVLLPKTRSRRRTWRTSSRRRWACKIPPRQDRRRGARSPSSTPSSPLASTRRGPRSPRSAAHPIRRECDRPSADGCVLSSGTSERCALSVSR